MDQVPEPCEVIQQCPICGGPMELVYDRPETKVCACVECRTEVTVPTSAWELASGRRGSQPKP